VKMARLERKGKHYYLVESYREKGKPRKRYYPLEDGEVMMLVDDVVQLEWLLEEKKEKGRSPEARKLGEWVEANFGGAVLGTERCFCCKGVRFWRRHDGVMICQICHPNPCSPEVNRETY